MAKDIKPIVFRNAKLIYKNFAGKEDKFNPAGSRNFSIVIDENAARDLAKDGWNVKELKKLDEDAPQMYRLPVKVSYKFKNPLVYLIKGKKRPVELDEDTIAILDHVEDVLNIDLIVRPYFWEVNGKQGITAYLKELYVTCDESELACEYDLTGDED